MITKQAKKTVMTEKEVEIIPWTCKKCGRVLGHVKRIGKIRRLWIGSYGGVMVLITGLAEISCKCGKVRTWDYAEEALREFAKQRGVDLPDPLLDLG